MPNIGLEFAVVGVLLIANALFAMAELAISRRAAANCSSLQTDGNNGAKTALEMAASPSQFLSTVQVGITLVSTISGAFGGGRVAEDLEPYLIEYLPGIAPYAEIVSISAVVAIITYLSVVIGELVPKQLALRYPETIAIRTAGILQFISRISSPIVKILSASSDSLLQFFGLNRSEGPSPVTQEEIKTLVDQGTEAGTFGEDENRLVTGVLSLSHVRVSEIMTPRHDVIALDVSDTLEDIRKKLRDSPHSSFPLIRDSLDHLLGLVRVKDLYARQFNCSGELLDIVYQPLFIPEGITAIHALKMFKETGVHLGFVIDEYGVVQGVATLNDVLEAIVGDLKRNGIESTSIVERTDGSFLADGSLLIREFKERFHFAELPHEDRGAYQTLAGFVLTFLGRIPHVADKFEWSGWSFEVVDMDFNRIDKVLISRVNTTIADSSTNESSLEDYRVGEVRPLNAAAQVQH